MNHRLFIICGWLLVLFDANEAPAREAARQKKEAADSLAAQEKAKVENKAVFRP
jgi:hypothetical protein